MLKQLTVVLLGGMACAGPAHPANVWLGAAGGVGGVVPGVQSMQDRGFSRTVHQQYDFSCGSAAVATLLTYQYGDTVSEQTVFEAMWRHGDQELIRTEGFSLLDIKNFLQSRGYTADGYRIPLSRLQEQRTPAIVLINDQGYNHFVVVKGVSEGRVLVGDPSRGARSFPEEEFARLMSNPVVFVVTSDRQSAVFNGKTDWATRPMAPMGTAVSAGGLLQATVTRSGPADF